MPSSVFGNLNADMINRSRAAFISKGCPEQRSKSMNLTKLKILFMFVLFLTATRVAQAIPGYHINDDASAKRAVKEFAEDSYKFGACVYQAELDKNLWRLTLAAHDYLLKKPDSPQGECSFASAYWRLQQVRSQETISPDVVKQLDAMFEEAARDTKEAANKLPNSAAAHLNYGQYLLLHVMGKEKVPTMLAEFKKAVALQPKVGEFHRWLAEGYAGSGDYSRKTMEAILSEGKQAVELDPRQ